MNDLIELQKLLAHAYDQQQRNKAEYAERKADFDKQNIRLTTRIKDDEKLVDTLREQISGIILEQFNEDGTRPDYPLSIQVRSVAKIHNPAGLRQWAIDNSEEQFLALDEKKVKEELKELRSIFGDHGEVLASMVEEPITQMGEKTILSWMQEQLYKEEHHEEEKDIEA